MSIWSIPNRFSVGLFAVFAALSAGVIAQPANENSASIGSLPQSSAVSKERSWKLITDRDGIQVYRAHTDDSPIKTFRGEADISLEDFRSLGTIMDDYDFVAEWMHMISEIKGVSRPSPFDRTVWLSTRLPWSVKDRDSILHVSLEQDPNTFALRMPFENVSAKGTEKEGYVRIPRMEGYLEFVPIEPGRIHLTIEVILDPGGYLPAWLANLILRDIPYFSLKRFRAVANTERYQGIDLGYYQIPPNWPGAQPVAISTSASNAPSAPNR